MGDHGSDARSKMNGNLGLKRGIFRETNDRLGLAAEHVVDPVVLVTRPRCAPVVGLDGRRESFAGLRRLAVPVQRHGEDQTRGRPQRPGCTPAHQGDGRAEPPAPEFRQALNKLELGINTFIF